MKNTLADQALENQDKLAMREFVGGDKFAEKEEKNEDEFSDLDEDAPDEDEDKIVPLEEVNVEHFVGIHPNHLRQVQRMVGNVAYLGKNSVAGRFGGGEE